MQKIKAFTLIELVVVMIITSFVFMAGYFVYFSSITRMDLFRSISSAHIDLTTINMLLRKDFAESRTATLVDPGRLSLTDNNTGEIVYLFNPDNIIRIRGAQTDTFNVKVGGVTATPLEFDPLYLSQLEISIKNGEDRFLLDYLKIYAPSFFLNHDNL